MSRRRGTRGTSARGLARQKSDPTMCLKIGQTPDLFFQGKPQAVTVYLVDSTDRPVCTQNVPLGIELGFADGKRFTPNGGTPMVIGSPGGVPVIGDNGAATFNVTLNELSMMHKNRQFVLHVSPLPGTSTPVPIDSVRSEPFEVVTGRLRIIGDLPEKWYKDEGGRENLLSVVVRLEDADGNVVTGQNVPLKLVLVYEDGKIANGQDKLYSPDSTHAIGPTGETTIRFRVEDVTKNHHNQKFRLRAMPDASSNPVNQQIAAADSTAVIVRSKRNKKLRNKMDGGEDAMGVGVAVGSAGRPLGAPSDEVGRYLPPGAPGPTSRSAPNMTLASIAGASAVGSEAARSLDAIIQWTNKTVEECLQGLEWQVVGYEVTQKGEVDASKPIYRCPACWQYADPFAFHMRRHTKTCVLNAAIEGYALVAAPSFHALVREIHGAEKYDEAKRNAAARDGGAGAARAVAGGATRAGAGAGAGRTPSVGDAAASMLELRGNADVARVSAQASAAARSATSKAVAQKRKSDLLDSDDDEPTGSDLAAALSAQRAVGSGPGAAQRARRGISASSFGGASVRGISGALLGSIGLSPSDGGLAGLPSDAANSAEFVDSPQAVDRDFTINMGISRMSSGDWMNEFAKLSKGPAAAAAGTPPPRSKEEEAVYYVIAELVSLPDASMAFPAFNDKLGLIGFYTLGVAPSASGGDGTPDLTFVSLQDSGVNEARAAELKARLQALSVRRDPSLVKLFECGTVDNVKQATVAKYRELRDSGAGSGAGR